ncbi:MAG: thiamine pyrophosphate-dependent enzyme [Alphaproteobacteria bacterium]
MEVDTYHSGDAQLYRGKDEVKRLREERDCIANFRLRVVEAALLEADTLDAVDGEVAALIDGAVATAREAPVPEEDALLTDVYVLY